MNRQETLSSLESHSPSVLIIGGGINGIGTFRDLALNRVDTLLVDRADFCSGASSASSRMAHGGIRYLENGEFRLVREAVQERNRLIRNAPDLVKPLPTTIPIFKRFSGLFNAPLKFLGWQDRPSERGALVIKIGLIFYDAFTRGQRIVPLHVFRNRRKSLAIFPHLNPTICYTATYYDGIILSPEKLALSLLLEAENEGPHGRSLNYVRFIHSNGSLVTLRDEVSQQTFTVRPKLIINAAGPWIDQANRSMDLSTHYIGPTKGSHLVIDNPELRKAICDHEFFFENKDGRIVLLFPLFDKVMIGTSDLPIADPDSARCTEEEVSYFIEMIGRVFPGIKVEPGQIIFRFSGVRPLALSSTRNAGEITRDHHIREDRIGNMPVYSLVGGKWTSFRAFSEQVTDRVLAFFDLPRIKDTKSLSISGSTGSKVLHTDSQFNPSEIAEIAEREKIVHLDDLLLRRTLLAYLGQLTPALVERLSNHLGNALHWAGDQRRMEVERALMILKDRHGVFL